MDISEFIRSLSATGPQVFNSPLLEALWYDARGDWERAHQIAQEVETSEGSWVHAYLHRKEGDLGNARYWYSRAGRNPEHASLDAEWRAICEALLARAG